MNIVYSWLKDYIDLPISAKETAAVLTQIGLETGSVDEEELVKGGLNGLVVGQVLLRKNIPNPYHLSKTTVDIGQGELLPIICGAPNVAAGRKWSWLLLVPFCIRVTRNLKSKNQKSGERSRRE
jgi:phenylalanyl-tRNA synthetase beta chain